MFAVGILVVLAGLAATLPAAGGAKDATAPGKGDAVQTFEATFAAGAAMSAGDFASAVRKAANIGSSGQDGFSVDSFFDITYRVSPDDSTRKSATTISVVIHAEPNNPETLNPGAIIDAVNKATGKKKEYVGHVTLIR